MSSTPRLPPVPPNKGGEIDKTTAKPHRMVEKVEKISEIDDETRARQFRQYVEAEDEEEDSSLQTPFTLFSSSDSASYTASVESVPSTQDPSLTSAAEDALPSPSYSPPPSTILADTAAQDNEEASPLPQSSQFWQTVDDPPEPSNMQSEMEESPISASRSIASKSQTEGSQTETTPQEIEEGLIPVQGKKKRKAPFSKLSEPAKEMKESPFGPPGKPTARDEISKKEPDQASPFSTKSGGPKGVIASRGEEAGPKYISSQKERREPELLAGPAAATYRAALAKGEEEEELLIQKGAAAAKKGKELIGAPITREQKERGERGPQKEEMEAAMQIQSPTTTPLPSSVVPFAAAAATNAARYLGMEALAVYFHIIGTITAMVSPKGDSLTEFVLNAPGFANSKFYGSKISIEKFATAPDQLNIRLTGSNDAVAAFNQNIPNFLAAFEGGKFPFTIHRIEASYEKPLFHRKGKASDKGGM
jgi:hypothetical protein